MLDESEEACDVLLLQTGLLNKLSKLKLQKRGEARAPWLRIRRRDRIVSATTRKLLEVVNLIRQATVGVVLDHEVIHLVSSILPYKRHHTVSGIGHDRHSDCGLSWWQCGWRGGINQGWGGEASWGRHG